MDIKEILKHVDHTLLTQTATWAEIKQICDDGCLRNCFCLYSAVLCKTGKRISSG